MKIGATPLVHRLRRRLLGAQAAPQPADAAAPATDTARVTLSRRIRALEADDPERPRKVMRLYFESLLSAEFGVHLLHDPAFQTLVDQVHETLAADTRLAPLLDRAAQQLIAQA